MKNIVEWTLIVSVTFTDTLYTFLVERQNPDYQVIKIKVSISKTGEARVGITYRRKESFLPIMNYK